MVSLLQEVLLVPRTSIAEWLMEGVYHKRTEAVHPQPQTERGREENCTIPSLPDLKSIQYLLGGLHFTTAFYTSPEV